MARRPHRLPDAEVLGEHRYLLTVCTFRRRRYFEVPSIIELVRRRLLEQATSDGFQLPAYCFMPDHVHLLAIGASPDADMHRFVRRFKQRTGFEVRRTIGAPLWQPSYFDRTLRHDDALGTAIRYVIDNPVRAGLVHDLADYPSWGSGMGSREELLDWIGDLPRG